MLRNGYGEDRPSGDASGTAHAEHAEPGVLRLRRLDRGELSLLCRDELVNVLGDIGRLVNQSAGYEVDVLGALEALSRSGVAPDAVPHQTLRDAAGISERDARRASRIAAKARRHEAVLGALSDGDINPAQAEAICDARVPDPVRAELVAAASGEDTDATRRHVRDAEARHSSESSAERFKRQRAARQAGWGRDHEGMLKLWARFDPETGARVEAALESLRRALWQHDKTQGSGRRTPAQRDADTLAFALAGVTLTDEDAQIVTDLLARSRRHDPSPELPVESSPGLPTQPNPGPPAEATAGPRAEATAGLATDDKPALPTQPNPGPPAEATAELATDNSPALPTQPNPGPPAEATAGPRAEATAELATDNSPALPTQPNPGPPAEATAGPPAEATAELAADNSPGLPTQPNPGLADDDKPALPTQPNPGPHAEATAGLADDDKPALPTQPNPGPHAEATAGLADDDKPALPTQPNPGPHAEATAGLAGDDRPAPRAEATAELAGDDRPALPAQPNPGPHAEATAELAADDRPGPRAEATAELAGDDRPALPAQPNPGLPTQPNPGPRAEATAGPRAEATAGLAGDNSPGLPAQPSPGPRAEAIAGLAGDDRPALPTQPSPGLCAEVALPRLPPAQISVVIGLDALRGLTDEAGLTDAGTELAPEIVRRLACDGELIPITLGGPGGPADIGRVRRTVPLRLRRLLIARDKHCRWPGCAMPPSRCDAHHIIHWAANGPTDLANLVLLCHRHHQHLHEYGYLLIPQPDGTWVPTRQPEQQSPTPHSTCQPQAP